MKGLRWSGVLSLLLCTGCSSFNFYSQAVVGHLRIISDRQPIEKVLASEDTSDALAARLKLTQAVRRFAATELALPDNDSYTTYVRTGRNFVTWNVVAAPAFAFDAHQWCFLVVGCLSYRGYYKESEAQGYAAQLAQNGWDVTVNGATAYSTLGWFDDPLLDTMLRNYNDQGLVGVIFHELAHQLLYVKGDSEFNESFASFVERQGLHRWLTQQGQAEEMSAYLLAQSRRESFIRLLADTREVLDAVYEKPGADEAQKRELKRQAFEQMRQNYAQLKAQWGGYSGYDRWFDRPLNNARLVAVKTYTGWLPAFEAIFHQEAQDFSRFYARCRELAALPREARERELNNLLTTP